MATTSSERIIRLPGGRKVHYDRIPEEQRPAVDRELAEFEKSILENPLQGFDWHSEPQRQALASDTKITAVFAGNQFGKTTTAVVRAIIECFDAEHVPERLRAFKRFSPLPGLPVKGWMCVPIEAKIFDSLQPAFEKWVGRRFFKGGSWGKAFNGDRMQLTFYNGSTINFKTYMQHPSTLGGATLHFVMYDEPPPKATREECWTRLVALRGFEFYAMTPLETNTGWIKREIYKKREAPHITVVRGSMRDNSTMSAESIEETLAGYSSDLWRRARETGEFVAMGGQVYELFDTCVEDPPDKAVIAGCGDHVVGIDPGIRNCGITFGCFGDESMLTIYDELLLQNATVDDMARAVFTTLAKWGVPTQNVLFTIDPGTGNERNKITGETMIQALSRLGVYCKNANNAVEAGIQQIRGRLQHKRIRISRDCVLLRDEADEYAAEDRADGEFKVIKENDHCLDSLRYLSQERPYDPMVEITAPDRNLGRWVPGTAPDARMIQPSQSYAPLGPMS